MANNPLTVEGQPTHTDVRSEKSTSERPSPFHFTDQEYATIMKWLLRSTIPAGIVAGIISRLA